MWKTLIETESDFNNENNDFTIHHSQIEDVIKTISLLNTNFKLKKIRLFVLKSKTDYEQEWTLFDDDIIKINKKWEKLYEEVAEKIELNLPATTKLKMNWKYKRYDHK